MFRAKTCFVLGAGASLEAGFPIGSALLTTIMEKLNLRYKFNSLNSGDSVIAAALLQKVGGQYGEDFNEYLYAAWRICEAAQIGLSIDNVIEQHDDDYRVQLCGKIAIAVSLLAAEKNSRLMPDRYETSPDLNKMKGTWYPTFVQMLCENVPRRSIESLFDNVPIVTFNYDRSVEYYLPQELMRVYGIDRNAADSAVSRLNIVHPYGQVAKLASSVESGGIGYGAAGINYLDLSENIITFSERIDDESQLARIRQPIDDAEQIVFLGSAFHRQNLELITPRTSRYRRVYATTLGIHGTEQDVVRLDLSSRFNVPNPGNCILHNGECGTMLAQNWRGITSEMHF